MTQFKAGDVVYLTSGQHDARVSIVRIERVTRTQAIDSDGVRYSQESGGRIPRGEWFTPTIYPRWERLDKRLVEQFRMQGMRAVTKLADDLRLGGDWAEKARKLKAELSRFESVLAWTPEQNEKFIRQAFDQVRHEA